MNWFSVVFPFVFIVSAVVGGVLVWLLSPGRLAGWLIEAGVMVLLIAAAAAGPAVGSGAGEGGGVCFDAPGASMMGFGQRNLGLKR